MHRLKGLYYNFLDGRQRRGWRKSLDKSIIHGEVVMFHHITNEFVDTIPVCRCAVGVFEHYLDAYEKEGYRFVSIKEATSIICEGKDSRPFCVITFDDIPENVYYNAYPILKQRGIPFSIFITSKYVDWKNPDTGETYITKEELRKMDKDPLCTVGAHTSNHAILRNVSNPQKEMQDNKEWLENLLGHPIDYLAYPYGKHSSISNNIQSIAKEIGFKCAFGTIEAPITDESSKHMYFLPRIPRY